jgi:hypothetical protein
MLLPIVWTTSFRFGLKVWVMIIITRTFRSLGNHYPNFQSKRHTHYENCSSAKMLQKYNCSLICV